MLTLTQAFSWSQAMALSTTDTDGSNLIFMWWCLRRKYEGYVISVLCRWMFPWLARAFVGPHCWRTHCCGQSRDQHHRPQHLSVQQACVHQPRLQQRQLWLELDFRLGGDTRGCKEAAQGRDLSCKVRSVDCVDFTEITFISVERRNILCVSVKISEHLLLPEVSSLSQKSTSNTLGHMTTRWRSGVVKTWRCHSGSVPHRSTYWFSKWICWSLNCCLGEMWFTGVAVWGSARNHPLFCGGPCLPHKEPSYLSQRHGGHHSQPGTPGRGLDGRLQEDLLSPQQECRTYGQWGQCDLLTMFIH